MINSNVDSNPENSFAINEVKFKKNIEYSPMMNLAYRLPTTAYYLPTIT